MMEVRLTLSSFKGTSPWLSGALWRQASHTKSILDRAKAERRRHLYDDDDDDDEGEDFDSGTKLITD